MSAVVGELTITVRAAGLQESVVLGYLRAFNDLLNDEIPFIAECALEDFGGLPLEMEVRNVLARLVGTEDPEATAP